MHLPSNDVYWETTQVYFSLSSVLIKILSEKFGV